MVTARWCKCKEWKVEAFLWSAPVSSEISDFTPCMHEQGNILHTKDADKTDY